jgi:hypothetical protein
MKRKALFDEIEKAASVAKKSVNLGLEMSLNNALQMEAVFVRQGV